MNWLYRTMIRPVLFAQDPEEIHEFTMRMLGFASQRKLTIDAVASFCGAPELPVTAFGLRFPNPIGLAAGMDKMGVAVPIWPSMGFGHAELGAVTWLAQPGNPKPRIFRAVADEAVVNRMGFNNEGAEVMAAHLAQWRTRGLWPKHPVGINLGKNKVTPLDQAPADYARSFRVLWPHADFFVVNVSSPNTPNLRQLQDKAALDQILSALQETQQSLLAAATPTATNAHHAAPLTPKPILVKVAPDLTFEALDDILELCESRKISGIIATNTTIERPKATSPDLARVYAEAGGLSGKPLRARSTEVIRHLYQRSQGRMPIVGVGGIFDARDAWEKITAGACLLQIYTGMIFEGPGAARTIVQGLQAKLGRFGLTDLSQAVGRTDLVSPPRDEARRNTNV